MLPVAQKLFSKNGSRSGFASTQHSQVLRSQVPFILPAVISLSQPTHCGRGMIVPVTGDKNTQIDVTHNMGRYVQGMWPLLNASGSAFTPKLMFATGSAVIRTQQQQSIIADEDLASCLILFF